MKEILTPDFEDANYDFAWLREHEYPRRLAYKLVCDRYRLNRFQRVIVYHSIYPKVECEPREKRQVKNIEGQQLWIDGFNVLFTLANYLLGRPVFLACDGVLRDAGEAFGKPDQPEILWKSLEMLRTGLEVLRPARVMMVLDQLVPVSEMVEKQAHQCFSKTVLIPEVHRIAHADHFLIVAQSGVLASSDSEVMDQFSGPWIDLPAMIILPRMNHQITDVRQILHLREQSRGRLSNLGSGL